jgi:hypothetical protein
MILLAFARQNAKKRCMTARHFLLAALPILSLSDLGFAAAAAPAKKEAAPVEERFLEITPESIVSLKIGKGKMVDAVVGLSTSNSVHLSYADSQKLGLSGSAAGFFDTHDKTVKETQYISNLDAELLNTKRNIPFYWPRKKPEFDYDSVIGPQALDVDYLSVKLSPPKAGEVVFALKLIFFDRIHTGWNTPLGTIARIGDQTVSVQFDPSQGNSYALGTVGRRIAVGLGGYYIDAPYVPTESNRVAEDPEYRIRKMTMGTPSVLGNLLINDMHILDSAGPDGKVIPDRLRTGEDDEAFAIVVDAMKREPKHKSYPTMVLGRDNLAPCSNISFDFAKELIYLTCVPHDQKSPQQLAPQGAYFPLKAASPTE